MTETTEPRIVVCWEGIGQPITLTVHGPDGEVAMPLPPKRALTLAKDLIQPAVTAIKMRQWGPRDGRAREPLCRDLGPGDSRVPTRARLRCSESRAAGHHATAAGPRN